MFRRVVLSQGVEVDVFLGFGRFVRFGGERRVLGGYSFENLDLGVTGKTCYCRKLYLY